jgi:quercetin dioxygenase-like cupin family protein
MSVQTAAASRPAPAAPAAKVLRSNEGKALAVLGTVIIFKDEPHENDDTLLAFEVRVPPGKQVPPHTEDNHESFLVLEGSFAFEIDHKTQVLGPGDFARIAPGVVHTFRNVGTGLGRMLISVTPGEQHRRFFEAVGEQIDDPANPPAPSGPPDLDRVVELGRQNGIYFLGSAAH